MEEAWLQEKLQMTEQIRQLQLALGNQQGSSSTTQTGVTPTQTSEDPVAYRPKPILPNPPKFKGERKRYEVWKAEMTAKIETDALSIGPLRNQFNYINSRLEGAAQQMCLTYVQLTRSTEDATPTNFFAYLDRSYSDPNREMRATERLRTMRQGDSGFASFLPRFERALADAGASAWADKAKIAFLGGTLNDKMRRAMLGHSMPDAYVAYVARLLEIDGHLQTLRGFRAAVKEVEDNGMDWEPTQTIQVAATQGYRQLGTEEVERCRRERLCFQCKGKGHVARECQKNGTKKSNTKRMVSVTKTEFKEESESTDDSDYHSTTESVN